MEDITDAVYAHRKRNCKDFEIKNLGKFHDLYVQSRTFLFADISENFRSICLEVHKLDHVKFLSAPELTWQAALKNTKVKSDLLIDMGVIYSRNRN